MAMASSRQDLLAPGPDTAVAHALRVVRRGLWSVAFFSFFINLLALTSSVYMLQVYDRVLVSRSLHTLLYLTLFAAMCLATLAVLEVVRSRLLVRTGVRFDARISSQVFRQTLAEGRSAQGLRDVEQLRTFFSGPTVLSLLDAPWMPVYIALVYLLHPWLGHVALSGGIVLVLLGILNDKSTRAALAEAGKELGGSARFAEVSARNAEVLTALGMAPALTKKWKKMHQLGLGLQGLASDRGANVSALAKAFRMLLQIAILGVGAWLVIRQETTPGVMIAASIIMGRGLAPVESAIGSWRTFSSSREAYARLVNEIGHVRDVAPGLTLPRPQGSLEFQNVSAGPPGLRKFTVQQVSLKLSPGTCLGITGPSAAGKSTLARLAVGAWRPGAGSVRLDDAEIADWRREDVGPALGYLPQDIELFPGTVAENIARFGELDSAVVVAAAQLAGAHAMVLALPQGYDTVIGAAGANLSGGQRQRIGLARAFYKDPALVVLDEPTSNLDAEGEASVRHALEQLKQRGCTVIVVAHRPALLAATDQLLVLVEGRVANLAPTAELMPQITRRATSGAAKDAPPTLPAQAGDHAHG